MKQAFPRESRTPQTAASRYAYARAGVPYRRLELADQGLETGADLAGAGKKRWPWLLAALLLGLVGWLCLREGGKSPPRHVSESAADTPLANAALRP